LAIGKKIPAPAMEVWKYEMLDEAELVSASTKKTTKDKQTVGYVPINIAAVFASVCKIRVQLDTDKRSLLPLNGADEANGAQHAAGHVNNIADDDIVGRSPPGSSRRHVVVLVLVDILDQGGVKSVVITGIGDTGERAGGQGSE
jgi:hypothetical protein